MLRVIVLYFHSYVIEKLKLSMILPSITLPKMTSKLWLFSLMLILAISFPFSFAQHHGGGSAAPPVSFGSGEVTVSTSLIPADFTPEKYSDANLKIRFFDLKTMSI